MAFHVACPITCKRICFCALGFAKSNVRSSDLFGEISRIEDFLKDPWIIRVKEGATIQVPVPKVAPPPPPPTLSGLDDGGGCVGGDDVAAEELLSAQTKRVALQKKAAVASMAAEDFARRFESGALVEATKDSGVEEQGSSNVKVMCRLCFSGEYEGSERAKKMLPCSSCGKKYHRDCLKSWSQHRDLFHWSSWTCPSCRTCEVCRRTGEPNKFKFCKRCDGAFHCYCMQPPHKNVSSGPYLCPKHTKCHSCGSNVPGNGLSVRWFLGYTCCDACGRLFTKGNYCPACLKVYRDSEATPMVCCDICQKWVHCGCDGISDERYLQFQMDGNLPYTCPTCRGECCPVNRLEDAVHELWRRRDEADRDLIASLRAAAGLPTQEEIFSISPFSDDEDNDLSARKGEHGRARFSLKSLEDFSPKKISGKKLSSKKHVKKKGNHMYADGKMEVKPEEYYETQSFGSRLADKKQVSQTHPDVFSSPVSGGFSPPNRTCLDTEQGALKHKSMDEVAENNVDRRATVLQIKSKKNNDTAVSEDAGQAASKPKTIKGTKLVIHLGGRNKTITNSPRSDSSSYQRDQELTLSGNEAVSQDRIGDHQTDKLDGTSNSDDGYRVEGAYDIKGGKPRDQHNIMSSRKSNEASVAAEGLQNNLPRGEKVSLRKHPDNRHDLSVDSNKSNQPTTPSLDASLKDSRPLLRLKFKTPYPGSWVPNSEEERGSVKGQRSKRKRPSSAVEKPKHQEQEDVTEAQDENLMNEIMDANWILKKLGKDAIGKRVEVHQPSDNSWHKGVVSNVIEGTSLLSIDLDDGRAKTLELGKQGVRFVPQKQKRLKS
ncbi:Histone-lysine N-methyltransferase 2B [Bienertia sinuspersici]